MKVLLHTICITVIATILSITFVDTTNLKSLILGGANASTYYNSDGSISYQPKMDSGTYKNGVLVYYDPDISDNNPGISYENPPRYYPPATSQPQPSYLQQAQTYPPQPQANYQQVAYQQPQQNVVYQPQQQYIYSVPATQTKTITYPAPAQTVVYQKPAVVYPQPQSQPQSSTITIYAAGVPAGGQYPIIDLYVDGIFRQRYTITGGDVYYRAFNQYTYTHPGKVLSSQVRIEYVNDGYVAGREDRNVAIDKIVINGVSYETESSTTYSTGTWSQDTGCGAGYKRSEWLHCNGYFQY